MKPSQGGAEHARDGKTDLGALSDVVLCEDLARLVRVSDIFESLCCVTADLTEEDLVAAGVLSRVATGAGRKVS